MELVLLIALVFLVVAFVLPIVAWISAVRTRSKVAHLQGVVDEQRREIDHLHGRLLRFEQLRATGATSAETVAAAATPPPVRAPERPIETVAPEAEETAPVIAPLADTRTDETEVASQPIEPLAPVAAPVFAAAKDEVAATGPDVGADGGQQPPSVPPIEPPPPPSSDLPPARFDWESIVGVKLFSAIAGIALVVAAVFFLRYSIDRGWLQPAVRVAIGMVVAVGLLVACELKAARRYRVTANALDAAAIAILFATFFAAHVLWNLIPGLVTFALLALVTALAVLLSIRRESLFIAVLGLLGGFATPALLSTGENRPVPLFAYLLLLNIGLAWVAYRNRWPVLTWLTLILTTLYQWGWVLKFLDRSTVPLAMGVFLVFPLAAVVGLIIARRNVPMDGQTDGDESFEQSALLSAAVPAVFAVFLAAVPAYGAHPALLFAFVLLVDVGFLAIALARGEELLHATGAITTVLTFAVWLAVSYESTAAQKIVLPMTAVFVALYLFAPSVANRLRRPFVGAAEHTSYAAPLLLFVFTVLARQEPAFADPFMLFAVLVGLVLLIAWRAMSAGLGPLYHVAAFFAIAAQGTWSASHLTLERLGSAVAWYAIFGTVALGVPLLSRRYFRPLQPRWGAGAVLLASLGLLFFLSLGSVAPAALWAMALLLAILNGALFVESTGGGLPWISQVGSILSWIILASWWARAAGSVGVLPSLTVMTGLTLVTLAGHGWSVRASRSETRADRGLEFSRGLYLGLIGHAFLLFVAMNRQWGLPPWPLFGALAVITLGTSAASLFVSVAALHEAGVVAAAIVVAAWASAAGNPEYGIIAIAASAAVSAYALGWMLLVWRAEERSGAAKAAALALAVSELSAILAVAGGAVPPFLVLVMAHAMNISVLLTLTWLHRWKYVAVAAVAPAWLAVLQWQGRPDIASVWSQVLVLAGTLYAVFIAYPLVLGRRAAGERDPYLAAVVASAMLFVSARAAFTAGGLGWMIGAVPVFEGAVLAVLLRELLRIQPAGGRDIGRLALVAGAALAFITVAIPLQLRNQWITIGWALEGAALAWLYRRITHRGLLYSSLALLGVVFVRLVINPEILLYEPRGSMRILNWYLYTYLMCAAAMLVAGWWLSRTDDRVTMSAPRASHLLPAAGVILLFLLLNIEIADYYATGPTITFRFGVTVSQDLTYTIGWLAFGMALLAAGIYIGSRPPRIAAVALIAVTTLKCFLYDFRSLEGLYRVASFVGLAMSLALVSLVLQKYVLSKPRETA